MVQLIKAVQGGGVMFSKTSTALSLLFVVLSSVSLRPAWSMDSDSKRKEQIHLTLYNIYKKQQRDDLAVAELRLLIGLNPKDPKLHNTLGTDLFAAKKWAAAIAEFNIAVRADPGNPDYWGMIGRCNMQLRRFAAACDAYQKAVLYACRRCRL
jgi:tetratricopeptide (TPR) repeat protein